MWLAVLSDQLRVVALVSRYLTNKLIRNRLLLLRFPFENQTMRFGYIIWYYPAFRPAIPDKRVH